MPEESDDPERRTDPREPIELKVEYKRLNAFFADYTKNISRGGTFIQTSKPLPVGTEFVFKLYVPTLAAPLEIHGVVKWIVEPSAELFDASRPGDDADTDETPSTPPAAPPSASSPPPGMGIRFVYSADEERRHIEHVVERLMIDSLGHLVYRKLMARGPDRGGDSR